MEIYEGAVRLRAIEKTDMAFLRDFLNDPAVEAMTEGWCFPVSEYAQEQWFQRFDPQKELRCIVEVDGAAVGTAGLVNLDWKNRSALIFYKMSTDTALRKKGDLQDAIRGILRYAFDELGMHCVYGYVLEKNVMSRKALLRAGFVKEAVLRDRVYKQGEFCSQGVYSMLEREFRDGR